MKQKFVIVLCLLLLIPVFTVTSSAEENTYVIDNADLLSESEQASLENTISDLKSIYEMDIVILTEPSLDGRRPQDHADRFYDECGYSDDGLLFLLSLAERDWYISTCGDAIYALTDYGIQSLTDPILGHLSRGNYYDAFDAFLSALPEYLDAYMAGSPIDGYADFGGDYYHGDQESILYYEEEFSPSFSLSLIVGVIIAAISVGIMALGMRTGRPQRSAGVYLQDNTYRLTLQRDMYLYSKVTKVRKPENNTSSGGGSSVHRSSGGRSHGGGGGKF